MSSPVRFRMTADLSAVGAAAERIRDLSAAAIGIDGGEAVELAFVEAANNVIQHGGVGPDDWLDVSFRSDSAGVTLELRDRGRPIPEASLNAAAEPGDVFSESSRGLWLIQTLMDRVTYASEGGVNALVLFLRGP